MHSWEGPKWVSVPTEPALETRLETRLGYRLSIDGLERCVHGSESSSQGQAARLQQLGPRTELLIGTSALDWGSTTPGHPRLRSEVYPWGLTNGTGTVTNCPSGEESRNCSSPACKWPDPSRAYRQAAPLSTTPLAANRNTRRSRQRSEPPRGLGPYSPQSRFLFHQGRNPATSQAHHGHPKSSNHHASKHITTPSDRNPCGRPLS